MGNQSSSENMARETPLVGVLRPDVPSTVRVDGEIYTRQDSLGGGSTGDVFLAEDSRGRKVVIKFYAPGDIASQQRELEILMTLTGLCDVVACSIIGGVENDVPFLVIELVDNAMSVNALSAWTAPRIAEPGVQSVVRRVMAEIVDGVAQMHEAGVAHLDLHPGNILVVSDGLADFMDGGGEPEDIRIRIIDFDRAVVISSSRPFDSSELEDPVDRQGFSDPEAVRTDVWQLGALAVWLTTGSRLMLADPSLFADLEGLVFNIQALRNIARGDYFTALKALGNSRGAIDVPAPLQDLSPATEIQPAQRMTVSEMQQALSDQ